MCGDLEKREKWGVGGGEDEVECFRKGKIFHKRKEEKAEEPQSKVDFIERDSLFPYGIYVFTWHRKQLHW